MKDRCFAKPRSADVTTRFLYVAGVGDQMGTNPNDLRRFFSSFGELDDDFCATSLVESIATSNSVTQAATASPADEADGDDAPLHGAILMIDNRRYCYIIFKAVASAQLAHDFCRLPEEQQHASDPQRYAQLQLLGASKVCVKFADTKRPYKAPPEMECTSSTAHVQVPGLYLLEEYITESEEEALMGELGGDDAPWKDSILRRVQHYGFPFNYRTLMLDYSIATPPIPNSCAALADRMIDTYIDCCTAGVASSKSSCDAEGVVLPNHEELPPLNQLTINEYTPGQGIALHTDTEMCLGPLIFILSLNSPIVMTMVKRTTDCSHEEAAPSEEEAAATPRKVLYLPRRSFLIFSGEARYEWTHGIVQRRFDKVNGSLQARGRRVSFTFRHAVRPGSIPQAQLQSGELEIDHVVRVYDNIAVHWNHTRGRRKVYWHRVKEFLDALPAGTLLADIGSGDGKYFGVNENILSIGCDRSLKLLEVSRTLSADTFCCDAVKLPVVSDYFDATLCIAVLHHLSTIDRRYAVISELVRITRPGGVIMLQAWALEQGSDSRRVFETQDTMVPWKLNKRFFLHESDDNDAPEVLDEKLLNEAKYDTQQCRHVTEVNGELVFQRYCHVYREGELEGLCSGVPNCIIEESGWDKGNWFVRLRKIADKRLETALYGPESKVPVLPPKKVMTTEKNSDSADKND